MTNHARRRRGFTLIELMVVVALVGLLSAIVVPTVMKILQKARSKRRKVEGPAAGRTLADSEEGLVRKLRLPDGILPDIESARVRMQLLASHHRIGMEVYTRFEARYEGDLVISNPTDDKAVVRLSIPLPDGTTEARDVFLYFGSGAERKEARNVLYNRTGIDWAGQLASGETREARVTFVASGRERFILRLPPARRIRSVNVALDFEAVTAEMVPDDALQPTSTDEGKLAWDYTNLVTDRAMVVDIPGKKSPMGRVLLLFRLVGIAVMLFGFGFWYLSDLYKPGLLEDFRWGHFFLLALTYSLFFAIFAVLAFRGDVGIWTAMGIAAALAAPLLVLHVSRVTDLAFASTRTIPLAAFTLAMVINGVYGGELRDYIFIGGVFVAVAFFTITYKRWATCREEADSIREKKLGEQLEALRARALEAQTANGAAGNALRDYPAERDKALQGLLKERRKMLAHMLRSQSEIAKEFNSMLAMPKSLERSTECRSLLRKSEPLANMLVASVAELQEYTEELAAKKQGYQAAQEEKPTEPSEEAGTHCVACGKEGPPTPFCPHCGVPRPRELHCRHCGATFLMPVHLLRRKAGETRTHCLSCGKPHVKKA